MIMTAKEIIDLITKDGWYYTEQKGSHRQYEHATKKGKVTVPMHKKSQDLKHQTVTSILKQAGLK